MIERLQITQLRNLHLVQINAGACNVMIGANGSGKTSCLEAIFLLSRGKSFRHHQPKRYIEHHFDAVTVFATLTDGSSLAIQKQLDATTTLRLNHSNVYSQSALTSLLPTLIIDPSSMEMLEQGSTNRRQLLDWLVFHMKPSFHPQWLAYQRLLKQRNQLLKQPKPLSNAQLSELRAWDQGLSNHAALIHHYRSQVFEAWQPYFKDIIAKLLPQFADQLTLSYSAGFDTSRPLDEQLAERLEQDLQLGYSRIGSHRADVHVHWRSKSAEKVENDEALNIAIETKTIKEQAANVLSRGEKKLLITALKLSQLPLLTQETVDKPAVPTKMTEPSAAPIVLIDDVTAELDDRAIHILLATLSKLPCQVFITSLTEDIISLIQSHWQIPKLFHVKHGQVSEFLLDS